MRDIPASTTTRVSVGPGGVAANRSSWAPSISFDGRYEAFVSAATNLVAPATAFEYNVFVHDRQTATTSRISFKNGGGDANGQSSHPSISADGR